MTRGLATGSLVAADTADFEDLLALIPCLEDEAETERFLDGLPAPVRRRILDEWRWQAHGGQQEPEGDWRVWLMMAGRGFGKTKAGAQWVWARARECPEARIALVGGSMDDVVKVMVEGESGLIATARTGEWPLWIPTRGELHFPSGAVARAFSAEAPEALRGPEHHFAWCDELAKWGRGMATWDNLELTMRAGTRPRIVVTTTPRPVPALIRLRSAPGLAETRGATGENLHLAPAFAGTVGAMYAGTRLGRQELGGELIEEVEGSLWPRALIEGCRGKAERSALVRVVIGVDPPADGGGCGIVACAMDGEGVAYVLGDHSVHGASPEGWATKVAAAVEAWGADKVVAEVNNGGAMVAAVLKGAGLALPVSEVRAVAGKGARAAPIATFFEAGRAKFAGAFPALEDELAGLTGDGRYEGPGTSPDRADAMVWAMTELLMGRPRKEPRIRFL